MSLHRVSENDNERRQTLLAFMKSQLNCGIVGYRQVYDLLVSFEQNQEDKDSTVEFVHYMAALEFHDMVGVWEAFTLYAFDTIIKRELSVSFKFIRNFNQINSSELN